MTVKLCECGCGQAAPVAVQNDIRYGHTKGQAKRFVMGHQGLKNLRHGHRTHGMYKTPEYKAWENAKHRCTNIKDKKWKHYGGRGIEFCFTSFEQFFTELGPRPSAKHSLDRWPNNDGHYEPGNVRWATVSEQQRNRRKTMAVQSFSDEVIRAEYKRRFGVAL